MMILTVLSFDVYRVYSLPQILVIIRQGDCAFVKHALRDVLETVWVCLSQMSLQI